MRYKMEVERTLGMFFNGFECDCYLHLDIKFKENEINKETRIKLIDFAPCENHKNIKREIVEKYIDEIYSKCLEEILDESFYEEEKDCPNSEFEALINFPNFHLEYPFDIYLKEAILSKISKELENQGFKILTYNQSILFNLHSFFPLLL